MNQTGKRTANRRPYIHRFLYYSKMETHYKGRPLCIQKNTVYMNPKKTRKQDYLRGFVVFMGIESTQLPAIHLPPKRKESSGGLR